MPAAPVPPAFESLGRRRFAFHPPIGGTAANDWTYRRASWSDILVQNAVSGEDVSIPRRFLGDVLHFDAEPGVVVKLLQDLEYRNGFVLPARPRVIEMPMDAWARSTRERRGPAKVVGIRLEPRNEGRASRLMGSAVALGVLGCLAVVGYSLQGGHPEPIVHSLGRTYIALDVRHDRNAVVRALGRPSGEHTAWVAGHSVRLLDYPDRGFRAVLMDMGAGSEHYIGSISSNGRVVHSVLLAPGELSGPILQQIGDF